MFDKINFMDAGILKQQNILLEHLCLDAGEGTVVREKLPRK